MNGAQSLNFLSKPMQLKLDINDVIRRVKMKYHNFAMVLGHESFTCSSIEAREILSWVQFRQSFFFLKVGI